MLLCYISIPPSISQTDYDDDDDEWWMVNERTHRFVWATSAMERGRASGLVDTHMLSNVIMGPPISIPSISLSDDDDDDD